MAINIVSSVHYNGGILPDIILLTHGYYHRETRLTMYSGFVFTAYYVTTVYYYYHMLDDVHYNIISVLFLSGVPAWLLMQVYSITVGFSPTLYY